MNASRVQYNGEDMKASQLIAWGLVACFVLFGGIGGCMWGMPHYKVYSSRMNGEAMKAEAEGSRQALVSQAQAEKQASVLRAEAATLRVHGWVEAAKQGCKDLGRSDQFCVDQLIQQAATYSIAKEGHEGVIISLGANPTPVAVQPIRAQAAVSSSETSN